MRIEDIVVSLNYYIDEVKPELKGFFIGKKNVEKSNSFGAIKTFTFELYFKELSLRHRRVLVIQKSIKSTSERDETNVWNEISIELNILIFKMIKEDKWQF